MITNIFGYLTLSIVTLFLCYCVNTLIRFIFMRMKQYLSRRGEPDTSLSRAVSTKYSNISDLYGNYTATATAVNDKNLTPMEKATRWLESI